MLSELEIWRNDRRVLWAEYCGFVRDVARDNEVQAQELFQFRTLACLHSFLAANAPEASSSGLEGNFGVGAPEAFARTLETILAGYQPVGLPTILDRWLGSAQRVQGDFLRVLKGHAQVSCDSAVSTFGISVEAVRLVRDLDLNQIRAIASHAVALRVNSSPAFEVMLRLVLDREPNPVATDVAALATLTYVPAATQ